MKKSGEIPEVGGADVPETADFAARLTDACRTRGQWLAVVRFGMPTLLSDPLLMIEVIVRRAEVERDESGDAKRMVGAFAVDLFRALGLKLTK